MKLPEIPIALVDEDQPFQVREMRKQTAAAGAAGDCETGTPVLQTELLNDTRAIHRICKSRGSYDEDSHCNNALSALLPPRQAPSLWR
jgi:hypothetical protein